MAIAALANSGAEQTSNRQIIRDPYVFEFLGLKPQEVMSEGHLEDALLDKLQAFLLELGHGFCFEARQKRLLIGCEHFFVDLVFYHRVLKCHVLIELKNDAFKHEHLGQLNSYVERPDIGILSDAFLEDVRRLPQRNFAVELLQKLLNDQVKSRMRTNVVLKRRFSERLQAALNRYLIWRLSSRTDQLPRRASPS